MMMVKFFALLIGAFVLLCFSPLSADAKPPKIDKTKQLSSEGLAPVKNTPLDEVWVKPNINLGQYISIMIGDVEIHQKLDRNEYQLSEKSLHQITSKFREYLLIEIANESGFALTSEPSSKTLQLDVVLSDVEVNVSRKAAKNNGSKTYAQTLGELEVEGVLRNASTQEVLFRFEDEREIEHFYFEEINAVTVGNDFRRIMRKWASIIGEGLNSMRDIETP